MTATKYSPNLAPPPPPPPPPENATAETKDATKDDLAVTAVEKNNRILRNKRKPKAWQGKSPPRTVHD